MDPVDNDTADAAQLVTTEDGRRLAFAEYGDPDGWPVFFCQGTPSSRLWHHPDPSIAIRAGARIIRIDRPGFGRSDYQPGRTVLDWPTDLARVADSLQVDRFTVIGFSGGGPYAAACAYALPDRVLSATLVASLGAVDLPGVTANLTRLRKLGIFTARRAPALLRPSLWLLGPGRDPSRFFDRFTAGFPTRDRELLARPDTRTIIVDSYRESARAGHRGFARELALLARPWGFPLADIRVPVFLWHGEEDASTPIPMAHHMAAAFPDPTTHFLPGEGHFLILDHYAEILAEARRAAEQATSRDPST